MSRRAQIVCGALALVVVGGGWWARSEPPKMLSRADADGFLRQLMQLPLIVYDSPAPEAQWRRRCSAALHEPSARQRAAVASVAATVARRPDHHILGDGNRLSASLREIVVAHADDIVECRRRVPAIAATWAGVEQTLRTAALGKVDRGVTLSGVLGMRRHGR